MENRDQIINIVNEIFNGGIAESFISKILFLVLLSKTNHGMNPTQRQIAKTNILIKSTS